MQNWFLNAAGALWTGLWIFWLAGAITSKRTVRRQSANSRIIQIFPVLAGFYMLFGPGTWPRWLQLRFLPDSIAVLWGGLILTAAGIAFAIWARVFLGRNWSGTVTIKEQHELIQTGPYGIVRHPIYSGLLTAFLGTAAIHGELRGLIGFFLALVGWGAKMRLEESFMVTLFGSAYSDYKRRVKALVPFVV